MAAAEYPDGFGTGLRVVELQIAILTSPYSVNEELQIGILTRPYSVKLILCRVVFVCGHMHNVLGDIHTFTRSN